MKITQSFIKSMRSYLAGEECGHLIKHQYVDGKLLEIDSKPMAEGRFFEFNVSGGLPKNKQVPQPVWMVAALKKPVGDRKPEDMMQGYRRAVFNAKAIKKLLQEDLGLKFLKIGVTLTKGDFQGDIDIIVQATKDVLFEDISWHVGDVFVIDLKYSGLLNMDRPRDKNGWDWSDIQKIEHGTQAKQYHYITGMPFYFLVTASTNDEDAETEDGKKTFQPTEAKFFYVPVDEHMIEAHVSEGLKLRDILDKQVEMGLTPRPEYSKCSGCPLRADCPDKHVIPHPVTIDLTLGV